MALDPGFALAWAQLSLSHSSAYISGVPSPQDAEGAKKAAERAMELAPSMPEGHVALGNYHLWVKKDPEKAFEAYSRGLTLAPDDALLLRGLARAERARGGGGGPRSPAPGARPGPPLLAGRATARVHPPPSAPHPRGARGERPWPRPRPGEPHPDGRQGGDLSPGGGPRGGTGGDGRGAERGGAYGARGPLRRW